MPSLANPEGTIGFASILQSRFAAGKSQVRSADTFAEGVTTGVVTLHRLESLKPIGSHLSALGPVSDEAYG